MRVWGLVKRLFRLLGLMSVLRPEFEVRPYTFCDTIWFDL